MAHRGPHTQGSSEHRVKTPDHPVVAMRHSHAGPELSVLRGHTVIAFPTSLSAFWTHQMASSDVPLQGHATSAWLLQRLFEEVAQLVILLLAPLPDALVLPVVVLANLE